jgi:hypothetical protein
MTSPRSTHRRSRKKNKTTPGFFSHADRSDEASMKHQWRDEDCKYSWIYLKKKQEQNNNARFKSWTFTFSQKKDVLTGAFGSSMRNQSYPSYLKFTGPRILQQASAPRETLL